jgi:hypothetical protein
MSRILTLSETFTIKTRLIPDSAHQLTPNAAPYLNAAARVILNDRRYRKKLPASSRLVYRIGVRDHGRWRAASYLCGIGGDSRR